MYFASFAMTMPEATLARWNLYIYFTFALPNCIMVLKSKHPNCSIQTEPLTFTGQASIQFPELPDGWQHRLACNAPGGLYQVKEEEIDFRNILHQGNLETNVYAQELSKELEKYEKADLYPPRFQAIINKQPTATGDLNFELNISDANRKISFHVVPFSATAQVPENKLQEPVPRLLGAAAAPERNNLILTQSKCSNSSNDTHPKLLAPDDLVDVLEMLSNFGKWMRIGLNLGLLFNTLEMISTNKGGDVEACTMKMLNSWLNQEDNVRQKGGPSWEQLVTALRKTNEHRLADDIEEKYLRKEVTGSSQAFSSQK